MDGICLEIPGNVENLQLPDPSLLNHYRNLQDRILWFDHEIDATYVEYQKYILDWNREDREISIEDRKPIKCFFNTPGGDLDMTISMMSLIKLSKTPVIGVNMGTAYSGGLFIYQTCHRRLALPGSFFLFHKGSADGISGTADQIEAITAQYKKQITQLVDDFTKMTNIPKSTLASKKNKEWFISAAEAVDLGIVQEIISDIDLIL